MNIAKAEALIPNNWPHSIPKATDRKIICENLIQELINQLFTENRNLTEWEFRCLSQTLTAIKDGFYTLAGQEEMRVFVNQEAYRNDINQLEHHYGLPNVARRLIEAFLAFRFPEMSGNLGPRFERVDFDSAKMTCILRLLNTYSHAGAIADPGHDLSLLTET